MDRVFDSGASATPPSPPASPSTGYATAGNPATSTPATKPGKYWYHMVTEELRKVIVDAGLTPDHTNVNQLSQAIQQLINAGGIKLPVRAATTANIATLAGGAPSTLDGVALVANDRILVKDQTTGSQNGIYVVTTLGSGANGTWERATDTDGVGELFAGLLVVVQEGTASADTVWELSTDGAITIGATAIAFARKDAFSSASIQGRFKNLQLSATGTNASVSVSYDELVLGDGSGNYITDRNASATINTASTGAGGLDTGVLAASTWYSIWRIAKTDGTKNWLISLSETAPTMPAGYTLKARIGWMRTDGTANKYPLGFTQRGEKVAYLTAAGSNQTKLPTMVSGVQGTSPNTFVSVAVGNYVPPTARVIKVLAADTTASSSSLMIVAPNNTYRYAYGGGTSSNPAPLQGNSSASGAGIHPSGEIVLESTNIYVILVAAACVVNCIGWDDNL